MGTEYTLVDLTGKQALDVGKFTALAWLAGFHGRGNPPALALPLERQYVVQAAEGWSPSSGDDLIDQAFSADLSKRVLAWLDAHVAPEAELQLVCLGEALPEDCALWTLWTHPVTKRPTPEHHRLFPPLPTKAVLQNWVVRKHSRTRREFDDYAAPEQGPRPTLFLSADHPDKPGKQLNTSPLLFVEGRIVTTRSGSRYELGEIDPDYAAWLERQGTPHDPSNPLPFPLE